MLESVCECVLVPSCTCTCSKQPRSAEVVDVEGGQERLLRRLVDSRAAQGEVNVTSAEVEFPNRDWNSLLRSALQEFPAATWTFRMQVEE